MAKNKISLDAEVQHVLESMKTLNVSSEEYSVAAKNLQLVCQARNLKICSLIEPEAILLAVTNLLGIIMIMNHERLNVITTKAFSLIVKGRF